ncbi:MAG: hypothetical protein RH859_12595 [Longimicrobiales bacterium]
MNRRSSSSKNTETPPEPPSSEAKGYADAEEISLRRQNRFLRDLAEKRTPAEPDSRKNSKK